MSENRYNNYNSGIKKSSNSYTVNKENYQKSNSDNKVSNDDILTRKIKDNISAKTVTYSKSVSKEISKSPYTIAKNIYKLDRAVDSYLSKPQTNNHYNSKSYTIKRTAYEKGRNNFLDNQYSSKRAKITGTIFNDSYKKITINKSNYNATKNKFKSVNFKEFSRSASRLEINYVNIGTLRFESKKPIDWNKAKVQRKIESFSRYLGRNKEFKLRNIRDDKFIKWVSKKYRFREKIKGNLKSKALFPYKSTKSNFKDTLKKVREGENEAGRETIQRIEKQGKRAISTGKYVIKSLERKRKFTKYQRIKAKNLNDKIDRVSAINRFKKNNVSKLNNSRFSGKKRFLKKRRDLKKFKKSNRFLLRQRFVDRLKSGIKNFFNGLKNPVQFISGLFRSLAILKTILLIAVPFVIIASVFSSFGMQAKTHAVNEKVVLVEQDRIFSEMHSSKYSEQSFLNDVKSRYPGYDKYEVDLSDVGYDNYELLAYLNIAYGNVDDNKDEIMSLIRKSL